MYFFYSFEILKSLKTLNSERSPSSSLTPILALVFMRMVSDTWLIRFIYFQNPKFSFYKNSKAPSKTFILMLFSLSPYLHTLCINTCTTTNNYACHNPRFIVN